MQHAADLYLLQHVENLPVIRVATPIERESEGVQATVTCKDLYGLNTADSVVGKVERMKELHVGNAVASIDEVVAKVQHPHVQIQAQALHT